MEGAMHLLVEAMNGLGAALLPVAVGLLFEELTLGGLVRIMLAPWPGTGRRDIYRDGSLPRESRRGERNPKEGVGKCSH
jgi:hypothetical protein